METAFPDQDVETFVICLEGLDRVAQIGDTVAVRVDDLDKGMRVLRPPAHCDAGDEGQHPGTVPADQLEIPALEIVAVLMDPLKNFRVENAGHEGLLSTGWIDCIRKTAEESV